jgi:phosphotransferase system enzyme I (PtsI)
MIRIKGKAVSPGIVMGKAMLYNSEKIPVRPERIGEKAVEKEIWRLENAVKKTQAQLMKINRDLRKMMGPDSALIIETQSLLLKDSHLLEEIKAGIKNSLYSAEWAIKETEKKYLRIFHTIPDLSFKTKSNDISDVLNRLIDNLKRGGRLSFAAQAGPVILVADDITPSEAAKLMGSGKLLGLVLNQGGETSHTVILARTMGIPAIMDTVNATESIANGDPLALDSVNGEVIVQPTPAVIAEISVKSEKYQVYREQLKILSQLPELTRDDHHFHLYANIELPFESEIVQSYGAKGIGLFRTEFMYLDSKMSMSGHEQFLLYKNIAQNIFPHPLVIRTYDLGRDKSDASAPRREENPSLGLMAVRMFLKHRDPFKVQIKAIQRANSSGNIKILFPMITEIEEIHAIKAIMAETREELLREGNFPKKDVEVGIMLEIPGAVQLIRHLASDIDFFSVGTNDLIQYLLAVDRNNSDVAYLFSPFHPAVIRILKEIRREAERIGKEVTICGEMAGKCFQALMLLGLGFTHFSMNAMAIAEIKRVFTQVHFAHLKKVVGHLEQFGSRSEIEEYLSESLLRLYPDLLIRQRLF